MSRARAHAADVGRDDHDVAAGEAVVDVAAEQRGGVEVVDRDVEEALDLAGMQIHRQHAVGAGFGDQVGDELGADRACAGRLSGPAGRSRNRGSRR